MFAPRSRPVPVLLLAALAAGAASCGSDDARRPPRPRYEPPPPTPAVAAELETALDGYRGQDPDFPALRDRLAEDPAAAHVMTRWFILEVAIARRRSGVDEEDFLREASGVQDPRARYALGHLEAMGAAAVPTLVHDLLTHPTDGGNRFLGAELLAVVGEPAVPRLRELSQSEDRRTRLAAYRALAQMGPEVSAVNADLRGALDDEDFTVRTAALRGLARRTAAAAEGEERRVALERMRRMLVDDPDPFVREAAAKELSRWFRDPATVALLRERLLADKDPDVRTALAREIGTGVPNVASGLALVKHMEECAAVGDRRGVQEAQIALRRMTSVRRNLDVGSWKEFLAAWRP